MAAIASGMSSRAFVFCKRLLRSRIFFVFALATSLLLLFGNHSNGLGSSASDLLSAWKTSQAPTSPEDRFRAELPDILVTDVSVQSCALALKPFLRSWCTISGYRRIDKELSLNRSWFSRAYVFVKEQPKETVKPVDTVVLDLHIGPSSPTVSDTRPVKIITREKVEEEGESESHVDNKGDWVYRSHNLWIKLGRPTDFAASDIDVLYGVDAVDPRFGWSLKGDKTNSLIPGDRVHARITIRLGGSHVLPAVRMRLTPENKFKIIQVADLHFSTGVGKCLDVYPPETEQDCQADPRTLAFLNRVLDDEKPNFAVLTGDQIFGDAAPDAQTALLKAVAPFIEREIPFAVTFGNHDDEGNLSRQELMSIASRLPFSTAQSGPEAAKGVGNYYLNVLTNRKDHSALSLYLLDTHKYSPNPKKMPGYNWIDESQLEFLAASYQQLAPLRNQYTASVETKKHLSMAFFHIPLTEYRNTTNIRVGSYREPSTAPQYNTGARSLLEEIGVSVVSVGHDHVNDFCMLDESYTKSNYFKQHDAKDHEDEHKSMQKRENEVAASTDSEHAIWLCHGGAAGLGGYAGYGGYIRRLRLFEVDADKGTITSWKRLEHGSEEELASKVDWQVLVEGGKVKR